ncbi:hypothetical protein K474DRAFT_1667485 [Panus rudis PR-1116 ss-1]|nr:hypothetical protein K474DRAFT_1667485 [Panus rudis PR-1116 ss-1]
MGGLLEGKNLDDLYVTAVRDVYLSRLSSFVVVTLVIYDYIVTLDREVELIWRQRWSLIKAVYLWHRYFGIICVVFQVIAFTYNKINDDFCSFWIRWEVWGYPAVVFSTELVLILWIWIVWNRQKTILVSLLGGFFLEITAVIVILVYTMRNFTASSHVLPHVTYCFVTKASPAFRFVWLPILVFDSMLLSLFLFHGLRVRGMHIRRGYSSMTMIYRHSLLNFIGIFASYLTCAIMWMVAESGLAQVPVGFALALSITNCTRLLLNIRRAYYSTPSEVISGDTTYRRDSGSPIQSLRWARANNPESIESLHLAANDNDAHIGETTEDTEETYVNGRRIGHAQSDSGEEMELKELRADATAP